MKKYHIITSVFITLSLFFTRLSAQVTNPDMEAIVFNEKITIQLNNALSVGTYFSLDANGQVEVSFYFGIYDPRNGMYTGTRSLQPNGKMNLIFGDIPFEIGDTLTFSVLESVQSGSTQEYIFINGHFFERGECDEIPCPTNILLHPQGLLLLRFNPAEFLVGMTCLPQEVVLYYGPGHYANGTYSVLGFISGMNVIVTSAFHIGLSPSMIMIDGNICPINHYQITTLINCSPWGNFYNEIDEKCYSYFETCGSELIELIAQNSSTLPCIQWNVEKSACGSEVNISRAGKVAIGTSNFSASRLSVKNGIITDKLKVTNTGWADYVFEKDYDLMPLEEVEAYIAKYHHLPGTPSGKEVEANGSFELGETTINHQVKIEEIFLHLIQLEEETKALEAQLFLYETLNKMRLKK